MEYKVKLDAFEGPLDLLLHLIRRLEIDIYEIPVAEITDQYLEYVHSMQQLELDVAGEYLLMAATLMALKSKMLLPAEESADENGEHDHGEDGGEELREALIEKLIEYKKYKEAAAHLKTREKERNLLFTKRPSSLMPKKGHPSSLSREMTVDDLLRAVEKLYTRKKKSSLQISTVAREELTVSGRMNQLQKEIVQYPDGVPFYDLFPYPNREHIVTTFLALLELMKRRIVRCVQNSADLQPVIFPAGGEELEH